MQRVKLLEFVLILEITLVAGCPKFWTQFHGSCYALIKNPSPWSGAAEICRQFEALLADITSVEENNFLKGFVANHNDTTYDIWIGGNDLLNENTWMWENGVELTYTDWAPNEPSNAGTGENCLELVADGQWNDLPCSRQNNFICELPYVL